MTAETSKHAPPDRSRLDRVDGVAYALLFATQVAVALAFLLDRSPGTAAAAYGLPLDDGWIHLVYARSLSAFEGLAYNPGQQEAGFTSPLWELLVAPLFWLRLPWDVPLVLIVKCVGVLVAWTASIFGYRLAARIAGRGAGIVLGLMIALDPWLAFGAVSGMEVSLAAATMLAAFDALLAGRTRAAGVALALAIWSRPECAVIAALVAAVMAWIDRRNKSDASRRALKEVAVPPLVAAAVWSAWCVAVTGRLLPSAFYLKHQPGGALDAFSDAGRVLGVELFDLPWLFAGSGAVALAIGAWRMIGDRDARRPLRVALLAATPVWWIAIVWAHQINEPLAFYWHRYLDPGVPLLLAPIAVGIWTCIETAWELVRRRAASEDRAPMRVVLAALSLPLVALPAIDLAPKIARNATLHAWSAQNIQDLQVSLGSWIAEHTAAGDWVATHDAGAIRFVSERRVIDMLGINDHRVLNRSAAQVFAEHQPRYLAIIPAWYPDLVRDPRVRVVHRVSAEHFVVCTECRQSEMVVLEPVR